ncbi:MAG: FG-GAP-like repeat-containing protein [Flavobacteriaceae bacterium]
MKKILLCSIAILSSVSLFAQVSFTNRSDLIENYPGYQSIAVDMNDDGFDDFVRVSESGIGIDYQQANGTFVSTFYSMTIQNVPDWSVAAGDIDGNGYTDLVLGNGSRVSFLFANADGTAYTEQTHPEYIFSQRSNLVDIDNDGDLDAFVCHDIDESHPYRNDGNQNMVMDQTLIQTLDLAGNYASLWVDYDNDGDTDMYLTKCRQGSTPGDPERTNAMYRNNGDGTYSEVAASINLADNAQSWTTIWQDFDNDGDFDAFCVNHDEENRFYENDGSGVFTDIIGSTGINPTDLGAWENQGADFNNDGFVDIFSEMSKELYINNGDMTFTGMDLPFDEGAIGDFNNDGYLDVSKGGFLWMNDGGSNRYIKIVLKGVQSNPNGIGARIVITGDFGTQMREVRSGTGFSHMSSLIAHFGLGTSEGIDTIEIFWPSGIVDIIENPTISTQHVFVEGENQLAITEFEVNGISLFPNPTTSKINFSLNGIEGTLVKVIDINGRTVLNTAISTDNNINVETLTSGIYFVQMEVENKSVSYKFVKK